MAVVQKMLDRLGLTLNEEKTMSSMLQRQFDFLGFEICIARSWRTGEQLCQRAALEEIP